MATTTTEISRSKLIFPDKGYDAGVGLENSVKALLTKLGDDSNSRYFEATIASAGSSDFVHNFKVGINELGILVYSRDGSGNLTRINNISNPSINSFSIVETTGLENTSITVTNNTGSSQDIAVCINHDKELEATNLTNGVVKIDYAATSNEVLSSSTGKKLLQDMSTRKWTTETSAANNQWNSVCWSPELSLFVAVAYSGTGNRVMTSPNGIDWTIRTSAADNSWLSVCWSPELSLFVAVASSGVGDRVMTSPNGINWTSRSSAADNSWYSVVWSPELSLFVAVANTGTGNRVMTSPNGIDWTIRTSAADNSWISVVWSPELSLFVAVDSSGIGNKVMTSL